MSKNLNWYKIAKDDKNIDLPELDWYSISKFIKASSDFEFVNFEKDLIENDLTKEAGILNQAISGALLWAAMLVLSGVSESEASEVTKVPVKKVTEVMKNPAQVAVAKNVAAGQQDKINNVKKQIEQKKQTGVSLATIVQKVLAHENLDSKQTPFRITSPAMKKWDTIYGFKIDKSFQPPSNKRNFLYLQNPEDVVKAVTALFKKYNENPGKYGLSSSPTLKEALEKFDQSGCKGKLDFLQKNIKGLDVNKKLKDFIS